MRVNRETELLILLTATVIVSVVPVIVLASELSGDDFVKAGSGFLAGGTVAVFAAYRMWRGSNEQVQRIQNNYRESHHDNRDVDSRLDRS